MPRRRRPRVLTLLLVALVAPVLVLGAAVDPGTTMAVLLGLTVFLPPLVLVWGETRGKPSFWGWAPPDSLDAELRRLFDDES